MKGFRWCGHCGSPHGLDVLECPETGEPLEPAGVGEAGTKSHGLLIDGKYRIGKRIGKGPTGVVYEGQQIQQGWTVAIKLVRLPSASEPEAAAKLARARDDARALTEVAHPNICVLQDLGALPDGTLYFVTERLRGSPIKITPNPIPEHDARDIMLQLLSALHAAHEAGVVHDNLKPTNIFLARRSGCPPLVKLLDFGGYAARTPRYMSPEALHGRTPDRRGDLWACGVILYRILTGQRPYEKRDVADLLAEIEERTPARPCTLRPQIASHWDSVVRRALEKDRKGRFLDAAEFIDALPLPASDAKRELLPSLVSISPPSYAIDVLPESSPGSSRKSVIPHAAPTPGDPLGRVIANKYRLDALLGTGSAGAVYRAVHVDLDRTVAVKVLHPQNRAEAQFVGRFKKEARIVSQLDHVNITRVLDFGEESDGLLYLVMEYVAGESLESVRASAGKLSIVRVINIGIQVCNALVAAHELGIVHRDIKPDNILLVTRDPDETGPTDLVKVCDFGTAKLKVASDPELTGAQMLFGSPAYMSPEQARCEELDQRSDLYSLGVTLYEALIGELPILGADLAEQLVQAQNEPPKTPSELLPDIDPLVEDILLRLLAKEASKRHATARELRGELQEVGKQLSPHSSASSVNVNSFSKYPSS